MDLAESAPPSASANLPPVDFITPSDLQRLNDFKHEEEDLTPLVCAPWSTASTSLSLPTTPTLGRSYGTPPSSLPSLSPESSTLMPLPPSSTTNKPRDRCDVIAELYAKGWRGEELEAEVRRREEEGRRRRGVDTAEESKPATVLTMSKAKVKDMGRRLDQEAKDKKALLLKAAMERWKTLKANSMTNKKKNARQPPFSTRSNSTLQPPAGGITNKRYGIPLELEGDSDALQGVPLTILPSSSLHLPKPHHPQLASNVYEDVGEKHKRQLAAHAQPSSSRPLATKRQRLDGQFDLSSKGCPPVASPPSHSPFESPNLYPLVPSTLSPPLIIQAYPLTHSLPPEPTEEPLIPLCQPSPRGRDTHQVSNDTLTDCQQPHHHHHHQPQSDLESDERLAWFGHQEIYIKQPAIKQRGHKRKRSISQPSSPSELNRVYAQLGVQTVYPQPYNAQGWIGTPPYPPTQPNWLADVNQHHPPPKPASPSAQSAPDVSADSSSHGRSSAQRSNLSFALRPTRSLPEESMQEGSKWDQACRRWEDRGGPLNFGSTVYHIARPSEAEAPRTVDRTLAVDLNGYGGGTVGEGVTATGLGTQQSHHGQGVQWNTEDDCHSTSFAPIDTGVQCTFSPEYVGHSVAKSWTGSKESLRQALVSALIELDAESEDLSPEQMMLMTPSQSSDYFGHSSQSIPPSDSSMTMAAEFGGHELGLGLVYTAQSPAESSF